MLAAYCGVLTVRPGSVLSKPPHDCRSRSSHFLFHRKEHQLQSLKHQTHTSDSSSQMRSFITVVLSHPGSHLGSGLQPQWQTYQMLSWPVLSEPHWAPNQTNLQHSCKHKLPRPPPADDGSRKERPPADRPTCRRKSCDNDSEAFGDDSSLTELTDQKVTLIFKPVLVPGDPILMLRLWWQKDHTSCDELEMRTCHRDHIPSGLWAEHLSYFWGGNPAKQLKWFHANLVSLNAARKSFIQ